MSGFSERNREKYRRKDRERKRRLGQNKEYHEKEKYVCGLYSLLRPAQVFVNILEGQMLYKRTRNAAQV